MFYAKTPDQSGHSLNHPFRKQLFPQKILKRILECGEDVIIFGSSPKELVEFNGMGR
jgi:hypothetical protein